LVVRRDESWHGRVRRSELTGGTGARCTRLAAPPIAVCYFFLFGSGSKLSELFMQVYLLLLSLGKLWARYQKKSAR